MYEKMGFHEAFIMANRIIQLHAVLREEQMDSLFIIRENNAPFEWFVHNTNLVLVPCIEYTCGQERSSML